MALRAGCSFSEQLSCQRGFVPAKELIRELGLNFPGQGQKSRQLNWVKRRAGCRKREREKEREKDRASRRLQEANGSGGIERQSDREPSKATSETELKHWCSLRLVLSSLPCSPLPLGFPWSAATCIHTLRHTFARAHRGQS